MTRIAIIGASHAGVVCAEKLREFGFVGVITLIDRIPGLPVQRLPLSKEFIKSKENATKKRNALKRAFIILNREI